jgi:hypothetical protein
MNKLDFKLGGHPDVLDDMNFAIEALKEALNGLASQFTYLSPAVIKITEMPLINASGSIWNWPDGFIWLDGEIFKVDAGTVTLTTGVLDWYVVETPDTNGTVLYENGTTQNTYLIRRAALREELGTASYPDADSKTIQDYIASMAIGSSVLMTYLESSLITAWTNATLNVGVTAVGLTPRYRKRIPNEVVLDGAVAVSSFTTGNKALFTLPTNHRPLQSKYFSVPAEVSGSITFLMIHVNHSNGQVAVAGTPSATITAVYLDSIQFSLD